MEKSNIMCTALPCTIIVFIFMFAPCKALSKGRGSPDLPEFVLGSHVWGKRLLPNGVAGHNDAVSISSLTASFSNGMYGCVMPYLDMKDADWSSTNGDKMDFGLGWRENMGWLDIDMALRYFNLYDLDTQPEGDIIQPHLQLSKRMGIGKGHWVSPFISLDPHFPARGGSPKKGLITAVGL